MTAVNVAVDGGQSQIRLTTGSGEVVTVTGVGRLEGDVDALLVTRVVEGWTRLAGPQDRVGRVVLGLTTLPVASDARESIAAAVGAALNADEVWVTGDAVTAHAGALPERDGVVLTVGTGVACLGIDLETARSLRVDGAGFLLGDGGGAFWMGSRGVDAVLRSRDGRGPTTSLAAACDERFGVHDDLAAHLHSIERAINAIAQFAIDVQAHAAGGDEVASAIVSAAAAELASTARAAAGAVSRTVVPIALSGRAVAEGTPLRAALAALIAEAHDVSLVDAVGDPLSGALLLATGLNSYPYDRLMTKWSAR